MVDWRQVLTHPRPSWFHWGLRWLLRTASLPYALAMRLRNLAYARGWLAVTRSPLCVISVGNLSVGGTGKTPMVAWLAQWLRAKQLRVAVLSRGYGQLDSGQNDEGLELELRFPDVPHLQHPDRVASAKLAEVELDMQVLLLDDGFQHRRLARDVDIVLLDATHPQPANWLLPGGLMREPLASLRRADVVVLSRVDQVAVEQVERLQRKVARCAPQAAIVSASHRAAALWSGQYAPRAITRLQGMPVLAFCAIGNPEAFFTNLTQLGAQLLDRRQWPDHHAYTAEDLASLHAWCGDFPAAQLVLCTMKDWVKIREPQLAGKELAAVQIELQFTSGASELEQRLTQKLRSLGLISE